MKSKLQLLALGAVLACVLVPQPAAARTSDCRPVRAIFYAPTDWLRLANALAATPSPCGQYYVSVPPTIADKTQPRTGQASQIRALGASFHALDEINVTGWSSWVAANGGDWYAAGVEARRRMAAAGFDVSHGDTWALNELSSSVRTGAGTARQDMRDFVRGLYDGDGSPAKGVVLVVGVGQSIADPSTYKANLEAWLQDAGFWTDMSAYVGDFLQEAYGDAREYGVAGADVPTRLSYTTQYLEHEQQLALAAPSTAAAAQSFLASAGAPLANAAWPWTSAYGYTQIPYDQMEDYVTAQVAAMRSYDASLGWSGDRIGFAWSGSLANSGLSSSDYTAQTGAIMQQLASAIAADSACTGTWCTANVDGAAFTNVWSTFASWTPTVPVFVSAPQSVGTSAPTTAIAVQLQTGGIVPNLPYPVDVVFSSSSPTGTFSTSSSGPWTPTLDVTLPAGSSTANVYMEDSAGGTPALTATALGQAATQVETVVAPPQPGPAAAPAPVPSGGGGGGGAPATTATTTVAPPALPAPAATTTTAVVAPPAPPLPAVHVGRASFTTTKGRLAVGLRVLTSAGRGVTGASVSFAIKRGSATFAGAVAKTAAGGALRVVAYPKVAAGCYSVHVKSVHAHGYLWSVGSPATRYCVTSTRTTPSSTRTGKVRTG